MENQKLKFSWQLTNTVRIFTTDIATEFDLKTYATVEVGLKCQIAKYQEPSERSLQVCGHFTNMWAFWTEHLGFRSTKWEVQIIHSIMG